MSTSPTHHHNDDWVRTVRAIIGDAHVVTSEDPELAERYADPFWFEDSRNSAPAGAVRPGSVPEVQELVRASNQFGVSLWPISRGRNLGYGGASPADAATWVLDLGRLDQIVEIDRDAAFAVIEPGVSFFAFAEALKNAGGDLWPSVPDLGGGSIIGNALERGFGYTSFGQHSQFLCGLEVVLPTGELLRTGMGAHASTEMAHRYKGGFGPSLDGLFLQSNLGIVVRAGIWLMPRPELAATCLLTVPEPEDLEKLVDLVRPLQLDGTIDGVVILGNTLAVVSQLMPRSAVYDGSGPMPLEAIRRAGAPLHLGFWNAKFGLYGRESVVEAKIAAIEREAEVIGATVDVHRYRTPFEASDVHPGDRSQMGIPSADLIQMAAWRGGAPAHTDFSLVAPTEGASAQQLVDSVRAVVERHGLDHVGGFTMFGRHAVMLTLLAFDGADADARTLVNDTFSELLDELAAQGHLPYRAHPSYMDKIAELYNFNDGIHRETVRRIKSVLDPRGVLAPGKQGVWPLSTGDEAR